MGFIGRVCVLLVLVALTFAWRHPVYSPDTDILALAAKYEQIGRDVHHSTNVASLDAAYGFGLEYHGRMVTWNLPLGADRAAAALTGGSWTADAAALLAGREFFVCTAARELDGYPGLRELLDHRYRLVTRAETAEQWEYVVYDLTHGRADGR